MKVKWFQFEKVQDNNFGLGIIVTKDVTAIMIFKYAFYLWERP